MPRTQPTLAAMALKTLALRRRYRRKLAAAEHLMAAVDELLAEAKMERRQADRLADTVRRLMPPAPERS